MVAPIQSLMNMEMALYGGFGTSANAPSYLNGYYGANNYSAYSNPSFYGNPYATNYGYGNTNNATFGQTIPYGYGVSNTQPQTQQVAQDSVFQGLSQVEQKALMNDYKKSLAHTQTFNDALLSGGVGFALMSNPRLIVHPINSFKATFTAANSTNKAFADAVKEGTELHKLWNGVGKETAQIAANREILTEAWLQHNKAVARANGYWKLGWIRKAYTGEDAKLVLEITKNLERVLKTGDMKLITEYTAQLKHIYGANPGFLAKGCNWVKKLFGGNAGAETVSAALKEIETIKGVAEGLKTTAGMATDFKKLATHGGWAGPALWVGMEYLMDFGKIKTAFQKDNETGMKQLGQTTVKGAGAALGWTVGEAAGKWAFAKWGAKIGSKIHPLLGTLIGGAVGFVGGSLGMWLTGKGTKAIIGQDVADDIEAKKLASTSDGQVQLLQNTMQRMQSGEKVSADAQQAIQKLQLQYA